jgi:hypothetical protein
MAQSDGDERSKKPPDIHLVEENALHLRKIKVTIHPIEQSTRDEQRKHYLHCILQYFLHVVTILALQK